MERDSNKAIKYVSVVIRLFLHPLSVFLSLTSLYLCFSVPIAHFSLTHPSLFRVSQRELEEARGCLLRGRDEADVALRRREEELEQARVRYTSCFILGSQLKTGSHGFPDKQTRVLRKTFIQLHSWVTPDLFCVLCHSFL